MPPAQIHFASDIRNHRAETESGIYIRARRSGAGIVVNAKVVAKGRRERGYVSGVGA